MRRFAGLTFLFARIARRRCRFFGRRVRLRGGLGSRLAGCFGYAGGCGGFLMSFLRKPERFGRIFHRLFGEFVTRQVIFLAVMRRGNTVGVRGEIVKFRGSLMRIFWHKLLVPPI